MPQDLFASSGTLRYRRTGTKYILYSVGPDGIDDGGKPIYNPHSAFDANIPNSRYFVRQGSKGDIVAGINNCYYTLN